MIKLDDFMALLIPILAIVMGIGLPMLAITLDYKRKVRFFELHHKERLVAIERGMEVPPLPAEFFASYRVVRPRRPDDYLRLSLVLMLSGLAIGVAMYVNVGADKATWALVPASIGVAFLLFFFYGKRMDETTQSVGITMTPQPAGSDRSG